MLYFLVDRPVFLGFWKGISDQFGRHVLFEQNTAENKCGVLGRHSDWPVETQNAKTKRRENKESAERNLKYGILDLMRFLAYKS